MTKKPLLMTMVFVAVISSQLLSQDWQLQAEGIATNWIAIDASDSNIAVAATWNTISADKIFRTLDGGKTWQPVPWIENSPGIVDISITDSLNFWVITSFAINHTSDGGQTWELQYSADSTTSWFNYIEMFDSLNGVAMGDAAEGKPILILKTTDGGKSWVSQNHSFFINGFSSDFWRCVQFISPEIGYGRFSYSGSNDSLHYLQKTVDGGKTWKQLSLNHRDFWVIRFFDENIGLAAWKDKICRTTDGGETWEYFAINSGDDWARDIEFFPGDPSRILIAFNKQIFFSCDTGKTWQNISTPDVQLFQDIKMVEEHHGWIAGNQGIIHSSSGAYTTSVLEINPSIAKDFALFQNYPNPFNSSTSIRFRLKQRSAVSLKIYNLAGEEIAVLLNHKILPAGNHTISFDAGNLCSGIYFYRLKCSQGAEARRLVLLR